MSTTRQELHDRITALPDDRLDEAARLLDQVAERPTAADSDALPPGQTLSGDDVAVYARQAHLAAHARLAATALDALGDYVDARPGLMRDLLNHPPDAATDPVGAALVDDQRRELAGLAKRVWRALSPEQKTAAVDANAERWR